MKNMRKKWLMPVMAFALAIGGAFASQASPESAVLVDGFVNTHKPCDIKVQCATTGNWECTGPGGIAYGMDDLSGDSCTTPLFRP
tara:strand:- start:194 stop:448 length:255 start_codon:yes stop_codon:yes gene_type:complete